MTIYKWIKDLNAERKKNVCSKRKQYIPLLPWLGRIFLIKSPNLESLNKILVQFNHREKEREYNKHLYINYPSTIVASDFFNYFLKNSVIADTAEALCTFLQSHSSWYIHKDNNPWTEFDVYHSYAHLKL